MQTQNYWKQFENTGKIEDYLRYKAKNCETDDKTVGEQDKSGSRGVQASGGAGFGTNDYAGIHTGDRHYFKTGSLRGI